MDRGKIGRVSTTLRYAVLSGSALYIVLYLILAYIRMQYPFELEWEEGAAVDHVMKILVDGKYYVRPSIDFVPSIYTPLYFYVSAAMTKLTVNGFFPLRLVSFLSSVGCFIVINSIIKRETGNSIAGFLGAALFAAMFEIAGAWFDVARVDSLFLFLLLSAIYVLKFGVSAKSYVFAGILISLSFLTKQTALLVAAPLFIYSFIYKRQFSVLFLLTVVAVAGGSALFMEFYHDGWFTYYVFLSAEIPVIKKKMVEFWTVDMLRNLPVALLFSGYFLYVQARIKEKKNLIFYGGIALCMISISWATRSLSGASRNDLFPAYSIAAILFGLGINQISKQAGKLYAEKICLVEIGVYIVCIIQFLLLVFNPLHYIPTKEDRNAGQTFLELIAGIEGEVYVMYHGYLPVMAGKKSYAHPMGLRDVLISRNRPEVREEVVHELRRSFAEKKFSALVIDAPEPWLMEDIEKYYRKDIKIFEDNDLFWTVTGMRTRPEFIYVPNE